MEKRESFLWLLVGLLIGLVIYLILRIGFINSEIKRLDSVNYKLFNRTNYLDKRVTYLEKKL